MNNCQPTYSTNFGVGGGGGGGGKGNFTCICMNISHLSYFKYKFLEGKKMQIGR
jgi:hypothetical protein